LLDFNTLVLNVNEDFETLYGILEDNLRIFKKVSQQSYSIVTLPILRNNVQQTLNSWTLWIHNPNLKKYRYYKLDYVSFFCCKHRYVCNVIIHYLKISNMLCYNYDIMYHILDIIID
jgi:hypothetical protein